ncbi:hypothetical protein F3Y22_tig00112281pilonHSYRG00195 [Hibiscus syriacus]|uniref:Uncharacterized protein n=1 Tax=Hibiscus syriacus TaxID=106335 RepID=A0A6A2XPV0_HIBSY|nr:hypothetical protein F3Y22_tig00112281pilonHSYRG00195 [Hibiscus syriacus]
MNKIKLNKSYGNSQCSLHTHCSEHLISCIGGDLELHKAAERGGYGDERYEHLEFQKKVAQHYMLLEDSSWKKAAERGYGDERRASRVSEESCQHYMLLEDSSWKAHPAPWKMWKTGEGDGIRICLELPERKALSSLLSY